MASDEEWVCDHPPFSIGPLFDPVFQASHWPPLLEKEFCKRWTWSQWNTYRTIVKERIKKLFPEKETELLAQLDQAISDVKGGIN